MTRDLLTASLLALALLAGQPANAGGSLGVSITASGETRYVLNRALKVYGFATGAKVKQRGADNAAAIAQSGRGNGVVVSQRGTGHTAKVAQSGRGNRLGIFQTGKNTHVSVNQSGRRTTTLMFLRGW